jgi:hypothetical protein
MSADETPRRVGHKWQPGQSGNPGGRRKEYDDEVKALARKYTQEALERLVEWMRSDNPKASVSACVAVLDRAWGRPAQAVTVQDPQGLPVGLTVVYARNADSRVPTEARVPLLS